MEWLEPKLEARGEALTARDHLFVDAGTVVPGFTLQEDNVEFFCHSPFVEHCDDGDIIRNSAALVFNVRLQADGRTYDYLEVGDADYCDLERIVDITKYHGNEDRLCLGPLQHSPSLQLQGTRGRKGRRTLFPAKRSLNFS
jgi:hypothetical protein